MSKKVRVILYVLSILTVAAMLVLIIFFGKGSKTTETLGADATASEENETGMEEAVVTEDTQSMVSSGNEQITEQETTEATEHEQETTLIFTGDVLFANSFKSNYDAGGIERIVSPELLAELQNADILMINNEFPFSNQGTPMEDKQYTFRCDPKYVSALTELGVDIVSLANNHTLDYGRDALSDTFTTLDGAGILYAGAGDSVERAQQLAVIEKNGIKFGFLAATRVIPVASWKVENQVPGLFSAYDYARLVEAVEKAQSECDYLTVFLHWGIEYDEYPKEYQTEIATACFDSGADLVIGGHTHCLQGAEFIGEKPVFYSLGNFIFGQDIDRSAAVKVTVGADQSVSCQLMPIFASGGKTQLMEETKASGLFTYFDQISTNAAVDKDGFVIK